MPENFLLLLQEAVRDRCSAAGCSIRVQIMGVESIPSGYVYRHGETTFQTGGGIYSWRDFDAAVENCLELCHRVPAKV